MDKKAKCSNRNCGWIGLESQMLEVVLESGLHKVSELHCPRCDGDSFYYKLKPDEVETTKSGAQLIALERVRQLKIEGWSAEHDDTHTHGGLAAAGAWYANFSVGMSRAGLNPDINQIKSDTLRLSAWPWEPKWCNPSADQVRNLVKAGALIAAEIDRLQRAAERQQ